MEKKTLYLPHELIILILLKLPVNSVIRFKLVCKLWFSLISDPHFASSHFEHAASHSRKIVWMERFCNIRSIDFEGSMSNVSPNINFSTPPFLFPTIKGSCRGFIYVHTRRTIYIWNPTTGSHIEIPISPFESNNKSNTLDNLYGFGYDRSRDDYLVVACCYDPDLYNISSLLQFFSFRDHKWREVEGPHGSYRIESEKEGSLCNGAIHWTAYRHYDDLKVIVAFDLMERNLLEIPFSDEFELGLSSDVWVFGEFLSVWTQNNDTVEIFVMKEYKVHSSWTKTLVFPIINNDLSYFIPVCHTKSGDILGTADGKFVKLNVEGQVLEITSNGDSYGCGFQAVVYTESLLSLPGGDIQQF
ncbi:F-box/kelch-repeat protein At3g06240-like [Vicia villosa]|uniref:F-box/kelch-repeat protein At3g06240-like n=1 Tax=Vicia villosa TaxID=3911 RepID=UPI00273A762D|nr:F-box/kelch-repeat protein At3g06240-like [Vicia villosa]